MNVKSKWILFLSLVVALLIGGCGLLTTQEPGSGNGDGALYTQAVSTLQAELTQQALNDLIAQLTQAASQPTPTATLQPESPTATLPAPTPTNTSVPPSPIPPTPTDVPPPCNQAEFVSDVTIKDGSILTPGSEFLKVWRLRNTGSCTWDDDYSLVYVSGDRMLGDREISLAEVTRPGERADLGVELVAPMVAGRYRGYWMLSDPSGNRFGIGDRSRDAFWVEIRVRAALDYAYDFSINMCAAVWKSSAGNLGCPGNTNSSSGSVVLLEEPTLENGRIENEPTLWTRPQATRGGTISGTYPAYKIKENDHFLADVGCMGDSSGCELTFSLDYKNNNGKIFNLGEWYEEYDGSITRINIDLSSLAGQTVQFILGVTNEGKANKGNGFWLVPSIRNIKPSPTPVPDWNTALQSARQKLGQSLGVDAGTVFMSRVEPAVWKDTCLGIESPDQECNEAEIPGWLFILEALGRRFEVHTDRGGTLVYWFEVGLQ